MNGLPINYKDIFESASDGILLFAVDGPIIAVNRGFEKMLGYKREELIGEHYHKTLTKTAIKTTQKRTQSFSAGKRLSSHFEVDFQHKNGSVVPVSARHRALYNSDNKHIAFQGIYRDISERRETEKLLRIKDQQIKNIIESAPILIFTLDKNGTFTLSKGKAMGLLNVTEQDTIGTNIFEIHASQPEFLLGVKRALKGETVTVMLKYHNCILENTLTPIFSEQQENYLVATSSNQKTVIGVTGISTDQTQQVRIHEALKQKEEQYRILVENSQTGIWQIAAKNYKTLYANQTLLDLLELQNIEALQASPWKRFFTTHSIKQIKEHARQLGSGHAYSGEATLLDSNGNKKYVLITSAPLKNQHNEITSFVANILDITDRKKIEEALRHASLHDALTGLPNRQLLDDRLGQAILRQQRNTESHFAVLYMDLDRFKRINDSLGHHAGDTLLKQVGLRILSCLRTQDTLARMGGDEFALIIGSGSLNEIEQITTRILNTLSKTFNLQNHKIKTDASIGIVEYDSRYSTSEAMLRDADIAMYLAKAKGGSTWQVFDQSMHGQTLSQLQQESELRNAIETGELRVHYQPIIDLTTSCIVGFEALIRWQHPKKGLLSPIEFLSIAEDTGLIVNIGQFVLKESTKHLMACRKKFTPAKSLFISVNVAAQQFEAGNLVADIEDALSCSGLPASALNIEVTENILISEDNSTLAKFEDIKRLGIKLSLDDFGTGYSSLSYLHRFPFDTLKIDRSFINQLDNEKGQMMVKAISMLAHGLGLDVTAEGVEENWQADILNDIGCEKGQGYYFSKPIAFEAMDAWLEENYTA